MFKEGVEGGYFLKRPNGDVWQWDMWQPGLAIVDFTNPAACEWYSKKLEALLDMGVDCFKTALVRESRQMRYITTVLIGQDAQLLYIPLQ